jgi:hypothetical protein
MGKIFNYEFQFLNKRHQALVSVDNNKAEPYIHIQLLDSFFKAFAEHIRYKGYGGYKKLKEYKDPILSKLIDKIAVEIEKEINHNYAMIKNIFSYFN